MLESTSLKKIGIFICVLFFSHCTLDPDKKLNNAIEEYLAKGFRALQSLEYEFINYVSIDSVEAQHLNTNGNILYTLYENKIEILYPVKRNLSILDGAAVKHAYISKDYCVITDGIQLCIFNGEGGHKNDETIGDKKHSIKSILVTGDNIIYFKDQKLYLYNILLNTSEPFIKDSFPAPFAQYYAVDMIKIDNQLGVLVGIAGLYNFSVVNLTNESVVLKNLPMTSSKLSMDARQVHYMAGNVGNWELIQYSMEQKKKKSIEKFNDILDIELFPGAFVFENKNGLWASEYGKDKIRIPFPFQVVGKYRDRLVLKSREIYYIVDMKKMLACLMKIKARAPELF